MKRSQGFSLVELLIAAGILGILLAVLGNIFVGTRRAYEANRAVTSASGQLRSAIESMQYDFSLAGFCALETCDFGGTPLEVVASETDGQRVVSEITSRYQETQYTGGSPVMQSVTYQVEDQQLVRSASGSEVEVAGGIARLVLLGYRSRDDVNAARVYGRPSAELLSGVDLRLEYFQGDRLMSEDFTVPLRNAQ